jgi:tetratricopeptide (TPR) repeat protein
METQMKERNKKTLSRRDLLFRPLKGIREKDAVQAPSGLDQECRGADLALKEGDFARARDLYFQCLARTPGNKEARKRLAYSLFRLGDAESARKEFETYRSKYPEDSFAILYLGLLHASLGDLEEATGVWKAYFNLDQPIILREINLQLALFESGQAPSSEEVVQAIEEAIERQGRE